MMLSKLQLNQIQQFHDGEIDKVIVSSLLDQSPHARVYLSALEELALATKAAMDQAWENAPTQSAALDWANAAFNATQLLDMKLVDLAPMLERFHDDEVSAMESASVLALMHERQDIADYLENLDVLSGRVKTLEFAKDVNFDGFFDKIAVELDFAKDEKVISLDQKRLNHAFSYEEHAVLLQRFFDGEVNASERQRVQSWIDTENSEVLNTLAALEELSQAATIANEHAVENADFSQLWTGIASSISQESQPAQQVVQLGEFREKKQESFLAKYQQGIFTAVAAVLLLGVFGPRLFPQERVIEKIVIIDGITSEPGTRVRIDAPISPVSAKLEEDEDDSTVIWITDESLDENDVKDKEPAKELKKNKETEYDEPI